MALNILTYTTPAENNGTPLAITNTTRDNKIYQTYRERVDSAERVLAFNLLVGNVEVRLHFVELFWGTPRQPGNGTGKCIFDVTAEDKAVMNNCDIYTTSSSTRNATMVFIRGV